MVRKKSKAKRIKSLILFTFIILGLGIFLSLYFNLLPKRVYRAADFDIIRIYSPVDFNNNGIDDYSDILSGAREDAKKRPKYDGSYQEGGYPPDNIGVCTDVVWRAFKSAGYNLREMVDLDIKKRPEAYTRIEKADSKIDFRRVYNLHVFFKEYGISLSQDIDNIGEWQPGDIVIYKNDKHIGIVSDKRNKYGRPYLIHNGGQLRREEDKLEWDRVIGHYRFDASLVPEEMLIKWEE